MRCLVIVLHWLRKADGGFIAVEDNLPENMHIHTKNATKAFLEKTAKPL